MKIQYQTAQFICADGKFFVQYDFDKQGKALYRQIEYYMFKEDCEPKGSKREWMEKAMREFEDGKDFRWAIGSTGGLLTARYQVRESDGELVSLLALNGGMAKRKEE